MDGEICLNQFEDILWYQNADPLVFFFALMYTIIQTDEQMVVCLICYYGEE